MNTVSLFDAKKRLSALVDAVEAGQEITITGRGCAVPRLPPSHPSPRKPVTQPRRCALRESIAQRGEAFDWDDPRALRDEGRR